MDFRLGNDAKHRPLAAVGVGIVLGLASRRRSAPVSAPRARRSGDVKDQLQGKAKRLEGALQDAYGQATETAADAAEVIRKSASGAEDFLRTTIEERPYTAAAVALGVGYLIGRFSRRENY